MQYILIVNHSPWSSTIAATAVRIGQSILAGGHELDCVFFREEGVYNSVLGTHSDDGATPLAELWARMNRKHGTELLVCDASWQRRLKQEPAEPFRGAGLVAVMEKIANCDRVLSF